MSAEQIRIDFEREKQRKHPLCVYAYANIATMRGSCKCGKQKPQEKQQAAQDRPQDQIGSVQGASVNWKTKQRTKTHWTCSAQRILYLQLVACHRNLPIVTRIWFMVMKWPEQMCLDHCITISQSITLECELHLRHLDLWSFYWGR